MCLQVEKKNIAKYFSINAVGCRLNHKHFSGTTCIYNILTLGVLYREHPGATNGNIS